MCAFASGGPRAQRLLGFLFDLAPMGYLLWSSLSAALQVFVESNPEADPYLRRGRPKDAKGSAERIALGIRLMMAHVVRMARQSDRLRQALARLKTAKDKDILTTLVDAFRQRCGNDDDDVEDDVVLVAAPASASSGSKSCTGVLPEPVCVSDEEVVELMASSPDAKSPSWDSLDVSPADVPGDTDVMDTADEVAPSVALESVVVTPKKMKASSVEQEAMDVPRLALKMTPPKVEGPSGGKGKKTVAAKSRRVKAKCGSARVLPAGWKVIKFVRKTGDRAGEGWSEFHGPNGEFARSWVAMMRLAR